jgi:hypothetical protein
MAHHKRKRARVLAGKGSLNYLKRKFAGTPLEWKWWQGSPSSHDIIFHHRPRRVQERLLVRKIMNGEDPEDLLWPLAKKPHIWYW